MRAVLCNAAHRGAVVGGRRRDGDSELYGCEGAHEAIVSTRLWTAAQARLERNRERGRGVRSDYLVSGLLRCVYCGEAYTGGGGGRSRTKDPERTHRRFYRDAGGVNGACDGRIGTIMRHLVDDAVLELLGSTIARPAVRTRIERAIDDALLGAPGSVAEAETRLRKARARAEARRDRLVAAVADGVFLQDEVADQLAQIRTQLAGLEEELQGLRFAERRASGVRSERDRLLQLVLDFPALAARLTGPALREVVEPWIGSLKFDKVTRHLRIGIRPIPAVPYLLAYNSPGPDARKQVGLIRRSTSLVQPGYRIEAPDSPAASDLRGAV